MQKYAKYPCVLIVSRCMQNPVSKEGMHSSPQTVSIGKRMWEKGWLEQEHAREIIGPMVGDPRRACVGEGLTFLGLCHLCVIL